MKHFTIRTLIGMTLLMLNLSTYAMHAPTTLVGLGTVTNNSKDYVSIDIRVAQGTSYHKALSAGEKAEINRVVNLEPGLQTDEIKIDRGIWEIKKAPKDKFITLTKREQQKGPMWPSDERYDIIINSADDVTLKPQSTNVLPEPAAKPSAPTAPAPSAEIRSQFMDAAQAANVQSVKRFIAQYPGLIKYSLLYTVTRPNANVPHERLFEIVKILTEAGADANARNPNTNDTVLHYAVKLGYVPMVHYLLTHGAQNSVNEMGSARTPLSEALRMINGAILLPFAFETPFKPEEKNLFKQDLPRALQQMKTWDKSRLPVPQVIELITALVKAGARDIPDQGGALFPGQDGVYYINHGLVIPEDQRIALLKAIGAHYTPRDLSKINLTDLFLAIERLKELKQDGLKGFDDVVWMLEVAGTEMAPHDADAFMKIALALFARALNKVPAYDPLRRDLNDLEKTFMGVALDLRRGSERIAQVEKEEAEASRVPPVQVPPARVPSGLEIPSIPAAPAAVPSAAPSAPQKEGTKVLIGNIKNYSGNDVRLSVKYRPERTVTLADVQAHEVFPLHETIEPDVDQVLLHVTRQPELQLRIDDRTHELTTTVVGGFAHLQGPRIALEPKNVPINIVINEKGDLSFSRQN